MNLFLSESHRPEVHQWHTVPHGMEYVPGFSLLSLVPQRKCWEIAEMIEHCIRSFDSIDSIDFSNMTTNIAVIDSSCGMIDAKRP